MIAAKSPNLPNGSYLSSPPKISAALNTRPQISRVRRQEYDVREMVSSMFLEVVIKFAFSPRKTNGRTFLYTATFRGLIHGANRMACFDELHSIIVKLTSYYKHIRWQIELRQHCTICQGHFATRWTSQEHTTRE